MPLPNPHSTPIKSWGPWYAATLAPGRCANDQLQKKFCNAPNARQQRKVHIHRNNLLQSHLFGGGKNVDIEWDGSCIAQMLQKSMKSSMGEAEIGAATCTSSSNLDFFEVWN
jgi:hypothetical protein